MYSILLIISVLPVVLIGYYIYRKDLNKESTGLLAKLFIAGVLSTILVLIMSAISETFIPFLGKEVEDLNTIELILYVFIGIALIEEFCKWIMVYFISYNSKEFDELYDMIIYAVFVSLGFACLENIIYVFGSGFSTGILRAIYAVPGHACDGIFMGYFLGLAKLSEHQKNNSNKNKYLFLSILIPVLLHGIYDYCILSENVILVIGFYIFVAVLYSRSIKKINQISRNNRKLVYKNNFCSNCGTKIESDYCPKCGTKNE